MAGNTIGTLFRVTTFGESHGKAIGAIVDGCPSGLHLSLEQMQEDLNRRKPGQSRITTQRKESDTVEILSGVYEGITQGTPITLLIRNDDAHSKDYDHLKENFRPSHADYTYQAKYGIRDFRGGGRSSARATAAAVAAGSIAKQVLSQSGIRIGAFVSGVGPVSCPYSTRSDELERQMQVSESNLVRCPDAVKADEMIDYIEKVRKEGDTAGGIVSCIIGHCPPGLGEPLFDKLQADLAKAMFTINAVHGFEYGSGFAGSLLKGSEHNDAFYSEGGRFVTRTNFSGGIQGGISNGMDIYFNVAFKPVATIVAAQDSVNEKGAAVQVKGRGRHDPCVVPRAVPIVEAMAAMVLCDHLLRLRSSRM